MNPFQTVLNALHKRMAQEKALQASLSQADFADRLDEWMLPVGEDAGRLLHLLGCTQRAKRILELGGSVGYSTLWLAKAAQETGGMVVSVESNPAKITQARQYIRQAQLEGWVEWVEGEAPAVLSRLEGMFDLVLLDVWKGAYIACFNAIQPYLQVGSVVVADNMHHPPSEGAKNYQTMLKQHPSYSSITLPLNNGLEISRKTS